MPRGIRRYLLLSGVALCAVLSGPIAIAQASDNSLRATLNSYAAKIVRDENAVHNGLIGYPQGKVKPLVRALTREVSDLRTLRKKLADDSATSTKGAKGRTDLIKGLGLIATSYGALRRDVQAAQGGPVPRSKVSAAVNTDKKGRAKLLAGIKLLS